MTVPEVFGCPRCRRSVPRHVQTCPKCGSSIGLIRIKVKIGERTNVIDKLVAAPPPRRKP
jgi:hypothetical protein